MHCCLINVTTLARKSKLVFYHQKYALYYAARKTRLLPSNNYVCVWHMVLGNMGVDSIWLVGEGGGWERDMSMKLGDVCCL